MTTITLLSRFKRVLYPIDLTGSLAHLKGYVGTQHGPQVWPWWCQVSLSLVQLGREPWDSGFVGKRLWVYTRYGAIYFDVCVDRRPLKYCADCGQLL